MAELHKRGSPLDSNGQLSQSAKKLREQQAVVPTNCVVKQEPEGQRKESIQAHACAAARATAFVACPDVDVYVRGARLPCPNKKFGYEACSVYYQAGDHECACQWALCRCSDPGCDADTSDSPARLAAHFASRHAWPVTDVSYAKAHRIALPRPSRGLHVLVAKEDESVFLVSLSALGPGTVAVSLVCVRANGGAAAGAPHFRCTLWERIR
ncbi:hypothetical protein BAE44_0016943 [Dichanthelium oligosanthes]|uniref:SIAH-type domain-containing protein n=1 Tax=Dichanthelium oligosanthes TaxID=888268 RepID=A0A1E5VA74_9POAL|nr:hypothetical protein BAE44_0016943 [Dichanthelium oligosanthes]